MSASDFLPVLRVVAMAMGGGVALGGLAWAVLVDIRSRQIPNSSIGLIALGWIPWAWASHALGADHLVTAVLVLALGFVAFTTGVLSAGDGKLLSVCALFFGPLRVVEFLVATAAAGGLLGAAALAFRLARRSAPGCAQAEPSVPYALAIAAGALLSAVMPSAA